jgi:signal transduction histidine kinase
MVLHEVLEGNRDEILSRWKELVRGTLAPESMPSVELINHFPQFLSEIIAALREDAGLSARVPTPDQTSTAAGHGAQRLRLGFSLDSVVREYGALRDAVVATGQAAGAEITFQELQVIFDCMISGIADAVSEYTIQRDAELLRQANEHFGFVAHELRNPLSAARTAFETLRLKGQLPADGRAVGALERGLRRTSELINQTLQMARVASGIELRPQWTTLRALLDDVELGSIAEAESKGIELRMVLEKDQRINLDVRLIRSAVSNLVSNGVKYSHSGVVELRGSVTNGRIVIEVEDACGGLEPGKVEEAFAPFVRLNTSQTGFGLGLAIARQAVAAHGGSIRVQNLPGKGCIFVLELPEQTGGAPSEPLQPTDITQPGTLA